MWPRGVRHLKPCHLSQVCREKSQNRRHLPGTVRVAHHSELNCLSATVALSGVCLEAGGFFFLSSFLFFFFFLQLKELPRFHHLLLGSQLLAGGCEFAERAGSCFRVLKGVWQDSRTVLRNITVTCHTKLFQLIKIKYN